MPGKMAEVRTPKNIRKGELSPTPHPTPLKAALHIYMYIYMYMFLNER